MDFPTALRAIRHRNYRLFLSGQLISLIGTWMQSVAQSWLIYRMTGSAALLGLLGFCTQVPVFFLAPIGGAVADRFPRRTIVLFTQSGAMVLATLLAALTFSGHLRIWEIFVLASALGVSNAFDIPARQSFVVEMVGRRDLLNAIALNSSMVNGARIVGPAVSAIVVAAVGEAWCFLLNAASYIAVIAGLLLMRLSPSTPRTSARRSSCHQIKEGFAFVYRTRPVRALLLLLGLTSLMGMPYTVLMPLVADRILHAGVNGYGTLMTASGVGALSGAVLLASKTSVRGLGRWIAAGAGLFGVSLIVFSISRLFWCSAALLVIAGFAMMVQMAASNTLVQSMVPDRLRGRVMSVYSMMFMGMAPFGALFAGVAAHRLGSLPTIAVGGAVCLGGAVLFSSVLPSLRGEARALILAQEMTAGDPPDEVLDGGTTARAGD